eukprot:587260-Rhodomonas_salina.2
MAWLADTPCWNRCSSSADVNELWLSSAWPSDARRPAVAEKTSLVLAGRAICPMLAAVTFQELPVDHGNNRRRLFLE